MVTEEARNKLISVFKFSKPYELEYHYRTKYGKIAHVADRPVLNELIKEKSVVLVSKSNKAILYRYIG